MANSSKSADNRLSHANRLTTRSAIRAAERSSDAEIQRAATDEENPDQLEDLQSARSDARVNRSITEYQHRAATNRGRYRD